MKGGGGGAGRRRRRTSSGEPISPRTFLPVAFSSQDSSPSSKGPGIFVLGEIGSPEKLTRSLLLLGGACYWEKRPGNILTGPSDNISLHITNNWGHGSTGFEGWYLSTAG